MKRIKWPNLVSLFCLNRKDKLVRTSVMDIGAEEKMAKGDETILIVLITIFILLFFARSPTVFLVLLTSGLVVGVFGLIKNYYKGR